MSDPGTTHRRLAGKVAVVTGGGNGIGRACCTRFADQGARVVVADILDAAASENGLGDHRRRKRRHRGRRRR